MKRILVIAKLDGVVKNLYNEITNSYTTHLSPFNWEDINTSLVDFPVDLILVFIKDLSQDESFSLHKLMQFPDYLQIPMILLGSKDETREHFGKWGGNIQRVLFTPITISVLLKEIESVFTVLDARNGTFPSTDEPTTVPIENSKKMILVVDDDVVMLRTIMNWLKDDYQVAVAKSGAAAIAFLGKQKPDLILLDYEMPVTSGYQTLQMIRAEDETKDIPVFFLTAVSDPERVKAVMTLNPEGYILKTCGQKLLLERIASFFSE